MSRLKTKLQRILRIIGPGVITGAADDDPSGIATYTQTGAQFGYGQLWTALFCFPLMLAVQEACARIGAVTGQGIAAIIKTRYSRSVLFFIVSLVVIANTINIGADIGAMAQAAQLLVPVPFTVLALFFTALVLVLEVFTSYKLYSRILKWFALALISYPLTVLIVSRPDLNLLRATFIPHLEFNFPYLFLLTGVIGTTISPYMFFWQASAEVEEEKARHMIDRNGVPRMTPQYLKKIRLDNFIGMLSSNIATWSIIVVGATVLNQNGITDVHNAADAARALEPLVSGFPNAGLVAKTIFAAGIIGLGLLAVPVLSGSAAYAISEAFNWRQGLNLKFRRAHGFYGVITIATLIGLTINYIGINPFKALILTAVINGLVAVPLIFFIIRISSDPEVMGEYKSGPLSRIFLYLTFSVMTAAAVGLFFTS